jgi:hypothetical protein
VTLRGDIALLLLLRLMLLLTSAPLLLPLVMVLVVVVLLLVLMLLLLRNVSPRFCSRSRSSRAGASLRTFPCTEPVHSGQHAAEAFIQVPPNHPGQVIEIRRRQRR